MNIKKKILSIEATKRLTIGLIFFATSFAIQFIAVIIVIQLQLRASGDLPIPGLLEPQASWMKAISRIAFITFPIAVAADIFFSFAERETGRLGTFYFIISLFWSALLVVSVVVAILGIIV